MTDVPLDPEQVPEETDLSSSSLPETVPVRHRLPDTRKSVVHKFNINGHEGYITVGFFENGKPGELFLKMAKEGSTMSGMADSIGILTSLALQYGVPVETLAKKFENVKFEPSGWTPNKDIRNAQSIIDYVFRWVGQEFSPEYRENTKQIEAANKLARESDDY